MSGSRGLVGNAIALVLAFAFVGLVSTCIVTVGIWPGEAKLTAPIFCPDDRTDAFVVSDTTNPRPGETVTNFSLHCVGERGEVTEVGFMRPFLLLSVVHGVLFTALLLLSGRGGRSGSSAEQASLRRLRAKSRRGTSREDDFVDASTAGPFVN